MAGRGPPDSRAPQRKRAHPLREDEVSARERREAGASPHPGVLTAPRIAEVSPSLCHPSCGEAPLWESYWGNNQALFFFFGPGSHFVVGPSTTTRFGVNGVQGVGVRKEQI